MLDNLDDLDLKHFVANMAITSDLLDFCEYLVTENNKMVSYDDYVGTFFTIKLQDTF